MSDSRIPDLSTVESPPRRSLEYRDLVVDDDPLGTGGQAIVYQAEMDNDPDIDRVALKQPVQTGTLTNDDLDAFFHEADAWETIDHNERQQPRWAEYEHIVGVVDIGDELPWIALEFMDGGSLADRLTQRSAGLPIDQALWIGESICRGLEVAHNYGIAHLDLKPANVLFRTTDEGTWDVPKISDWGLAKVLSQNTEAVGGLSVEYAAPEQIEPDEFGQLDMLTDVYQVGAIVYALLTGRPPYVGSHISLKQDITDDDAPAAPSTFRDEITPQIDTSVMTAVATAKRDRYDAIQVFKQALVAARTDSQRSRAIAEALQDTTQTPSSGSNSKNNSTVETTSVGTNEEPGDPTITPQSVENAKSDRPEVATASTDEERTGDAEQRPVAHSGGTHDESDRDRDVERIHTSPSVESTTDDQSRWFDPDNYPEASARDLSVALRRIQDCGGAESIADGLESIHHDSVASKLRTMQQDTTH